MRGSAATWRPAVANLMTPTRGHGKHDTKTNRNGRKSNLARMTLHFAS
jgi:hypothetical protein